MRIKTEEEIRKELNGRYGEISLDSEPFRAAYSAATDDLGPAVTIVCGAGGCGKSVLFRLIASQRKCLCVAPTGVAAMNVSGGGIEARTIHAAFSLPVGCLYPMEPYPEAIELLKNYDLLLVDEVSMVTSNLFDFLVYQCALSKTRAVFFGDPLQLPPVIKEPSPEEPDAKPYPSVYHSGGLFFNSVCYRVLDRMERIEIIRLQSVYRQKDGEFKDVLSEIRFGRYTEKERNFLNRYVRPFDPDAISLAYANRTVDEINRKKILVLQKEVSELMEKERKKILRLCEPYRVRASAPWTCPEEFIPDTSDEPMSLSELERRCRIVGKLVSAHAIRLEDVMMNCRAVVRDSMKPLEDPGSFKGIKGRPSKLFRGERVMCTRNIYLADGTSPAQNGSIGTITGFTESSVLSGFDPGVRGNQKLKNPVPVVELDGSDGKTVVLDYRAEETEGNDGSSMQVYLLPLVPAYAITYHKSQGLSLQKANLVVDSAVTSKDNLFYLGLSRLRSADGMNLSAVPETIATTRSCVDFVNSVT